MVDEEKETLLARIDNKEIRFRLDKPVEAFPEGLEKYNPRKEGRRTLVVRYSPEDACAGEIINLVQESGYKIHDIATEDSDLEDVFLQLTRAA